MAKKKTQKRKAQANAYQRKTRRISRWRSFRRGLVSFLRRGYYTVAVASLALMVGAAWWWVHSGKLGLMVEETRQNVLHQTADAGLQLRYLYLEGRHYAELDEVAAAIGLEAGDPILGVSVDGIKDRLKELDWVRDAVVERQLPDTLHVHIYERVPIAVWQHQGKLRLIDQSGEVIEQADGAEAHYARLLLVVGKNAPEYTVDLLRMLRAEPELFGRIEAAVRVGNRRWDVKFRGGIDVKLPADNPERAWAMLAEMERQQHVLARNIRTLDLRIEDRMFIDLPPDARENTNASGSRSRSAARDA